MKVLNVAKTGLPQRFKDGLVAVINYVKNNPFPGLEGVVLFGSVARGEMTCRSDIDICVIFEDTVDLHTVDAAYYKSCLCDCTGGIAVDVVFCSQTKYDQSQERLFRHIREEGRMLLSTI